MAYRTEFIDDGRGVLHTGLELVTGAEIIAGVARDLQGVRDGMPLCYAFVDLTGSTQLSVHPDEVKAIARLNLAVAEVRRHVCVAVVAASDHAFGMARMWEAHAGATDWTTYVFREAAKAKAWLADAVGDAAIIRAIEAGT